MFPSFTWVFCLSILCSLFLSEEIIAHHGDAGNQSDILLEVHCPIRIVVQVLKYLVQVGFILCFLFQK